MRHEEVFDEHEVLDEEKLCVHNDAVALDDCGCLLKGFCRLVDNIVEDVTASLGR